MRRTLATAVMLAIWYAGPAAASGSLAARVRLVREALGEVQRAASPGQEHFLLAMDVASGVVLGSSDEAACRTRLFSPGSLFKLVSAWVLAAQGGDPGRHIVDCRGRYHLFGAPRSSGRLIHEDAPFAEADDYFKCTIDGGHGRVTLGQALAVSCNVFFYSMHERLPPERLADAARRLGLTERNDFAGRRGIMPVHRIPGTRLRRILFPVGYDCQTTMLSAAVFLNTILNDGRVLEPQPPPDGTAVVPRLRRTVVPQAPFPLLRKAMREAVVAGTAAAAGRELRIPVGGKTGSGIRGTDVFRLDGWFISFAPADRPVVLLVAVTPGVAGSGAPLANSIRFYRMLEGHGFFTALR